MELKGIIHEDFVNYIKPSMVLEFPTCNFKCDRECGKALCQNGRLALEESHQLCPYDIIDWYINNPISEAIVCQGLEPFDSWNELKSFIRLFREEYWREDDIVIYTGYYPHEIEEQLKNLCKFKNIFVKFGRYIPDTAPVYDNLLGVTLASSNQYAAKLSFDTIAELISCSEEKAKS